VQSYGCYCVMSTHFAQNGWNPEITWVETALHIIRTFFNLGRFERDQLVGNIDPHIQSRVPGVNPPHSNIMCIFPDSGSQLRTFQEHMTLLCSWESIVEIPGILHFFLSTYLTQLHHEPSDIPRIARNILQSCTIHYLKQKHIARFHYYIWDWFFNCKVLE